MLENMHIERKSLSDMVVEKLEKMILDESVRVGEKLPSETKLQASFGVSRTILREALKTLRERGLIEVRVGSGVYVAKPKSGILRDMLNRIMRLSDVKLKEIFELRSSLECAASGLAAENADENQVKRLQEIISEMEQSRMNEEKWVELELDFHLTIAKASGNELFYSIISPIIDLWIEVFDEGFRKNRPGAKEEGIEGHRAILEAIRKKIRKEAETAMGLHLENSRRFVLNA